MKSLAEDLRAAWRALLREPGFTAATILVLSLGLGAVTAVFSLVNGVLLEPLAYREPDRLVTVREVLPAVAHLYPALPVSGRHFVEFRKACPSFEDMALLESTAPNLTGVDEPERLEGARISPSLFRVLGVRPALGRDFRQEEEQEGKNDVVMLTDGLWRRRFGADPGLVGRTILLNRVPHTVVGILPADFRFPDRNAFGVGQTVAPRTEVFTPKTFPKDELEELIGRFNYGMIARLRPGATPARAVAELEAVQARIEELARDPQHERAIVTPLLDIVVGKARRGLLVLMGAIAGVLLIVAVNLANLLLARGERRSRESAVRVALGAGRGRLMRHAFAETIVIAAAGALLALAIAAVGIDALRLYAPPGIPRLDEVRLDARVLGFAGALAALTALLFGSLPAWRAGKTDPQDVLRASGRTATAARSGVRVRSLLVASEVGLSTMLLILAGLLINSFVRLLAADKGFRAPTVLAVDIGLSGDRYKEDAAREAFYKRVFQSLESSPGVQASAVGSALPLQGETWIDNAGPDTAPDPKHSVPVNVRFISFDYFRTMGVPLRAGRPFNDNDRKRKVTIISENLAASFWPGQNPIGRRLTRGNDQWFEVVGVVGDVRADADKHAVAMMYRPYWEWMPYRTVLVARAAGEPASIAGAIRAAIRQADPEVPVPRMRTMSEVLDEGIATRKFQMLLAAAFAAVALLVAGLGIFAVISYSVARRTSEIGIRSALGASTRDIYGLVLSGAMTPVVAGLATGIAGALALGRIVGSLLYEVGGRDPFTIAAVAAVVALVALAACVIPARRAARVDPLTALRWE